MGTFEEIRHTEAKDNYSEKSIPCSTFRAPRETNEEGVGEVWEPNRAKWNTSDDNEYDDMTADATTSKVKASKMDSKENKREDTYYETGYEGDYIQQ